MDVREQHVDESDISLDDGSLLDTFHISTTDPTSATGYDIGSGSIIGNQIKTSDGKVFTADTPGACFLKIKKEEFPEQNAKVLNILPVPDAPFYQNTPSPSMRVGKFVKHPAYMKLNTRLMSFIQNRWTVAIPSAYEMAKAGMFYEGKILVHGKMVTDQVICYKCGQRLEGWKETDLPTDEHKRIYPDCEMETWIDELFH